MDNGTLVKSRLRPVDPRELYRQRTPRYMRSSVILPSQYQSYAVCVEFARDWFMARFPQKYFNSIYVDGTHSFDEFRKFSDINSQMKKANPLLAIIPVIDMNHNRDWIDSSPEIPMMMRRSRIEGTFFNDIRCNRGLHLQLLFKTVKMNFVFKVRVNTRAEQLDMVERIKLKHRAGYTETCNLALDVHVPKPIISQIAFDNAMELDTAGNPKDSVAMLQYLNSYSLIPFLYKLRCSTGNSEYFVKVPNCVAHVKSEIPTFDDGERQDTMTSNYTVDFNVEVEMTAPYCYTYFSQKDQEFINKAPVCLDPMIVVSSVIKTELPPEDENHWAMLTYTEYEVDDFDVGTKLEIPLKDYFDGTDLGRIIDYTQRIGVSPEVFLNFGVYNEGQNKKYKMDWGKMICNLEEEITTNRSIIAIYCDMKYVNNTIIYLDELEKNTSRIN